MSGDQLPVETPHRHHTWHILTTHSIVNLVLMVAEAGEASASAHPKQLHADGDEVDSHLSFDKH